MDSLTNDLVQLLKSYSFEEIQQMLNQLQLPKKKVYVNSNGNFKDIDNEQLNELFSLRHGDSTNMEEISLNHQYVIKTNKKVDTDWMSNSWKKNSILMKGTDADFSYKSVDIKLIKANMTTCKEIVALKSSFGSKFIAPILDFFRVERFVFIVRDHYELRLLDYIDNKKFNGDRMRSVVPENKICKQIAEGISYLHNRQIACRGIMTKNIMIAVDNGTFHAVISDCCLSNFDSRDLNILGNIWNVKGDDKQEFVDNCLGTIGSDINRIIQVIPPELTILLEGIQDFSRINWFAVDIFMYCRVVERNFMHQKNTFTSTEANKIIDLGIKEDPSLRPTIDAILDMPLFWDFNQVFNLVCEFHLMKADIYSSANTDLINRFEDLFGINFDNAVGVPWTDGYEEEIIEAYSSLNYQYNLESASNLAEFIQNIYFQQRIAKEATGKSNIEEIFWIIINYNHKFIPELIKRMQGIKI